MGRLRGVLPGSHRDFIVEDVDDGTRHACNGKRLCNKGLSIPYPPERMSALLCVEAREDGF